MLKMFYINQKYLNNKKDKLKVSNQVNNLCSKINLYQEGIIEPELTLKLSNLLMKKKTKTFKMKMNKILNNKYYKFNNSLMKNN